MKLATWNINSLRVRLPQVLDWLVANPMDVLCLQELKLPDERFPVDDFREAGYYAAFAGQNTYNGVAILSRVEARDVVRNIPGFEDPQQRLIAATFPTSDVYIRVGVVCCLDGQLVCCDKFQYQLLWFAALRPRIHADLTPYPRLVSRGDFNVA